MPEVEWISRGAQKVIKDFDQVVKATSKLENATKGTKRATEELGRVAAKISKQNETAFEKYTRSVVTAKRALDDNKISQETYRRELTRNVVELNKATVGTDKHARALKRLIRDNRELGAAVRKAGQANRAAFGPGAQSMISSYMSRFGPAALAAGGIRGLQLSKQTELTAGGRAITAAKARAQLAELSLSDPVKADRIKAAARLSFLEGGFESEAEAVPTTFELSSAGNLASRPLFSRLQQASQPSAQLARSAGAIKFALGGGVGTPENILEKAIPGAAAATGVEIVDIVDALAEAAPAAKLLGISPEEAGAVIDQIAKRTSDAAKAGTQAKALFTAFVVRGFADEGDTSFADMLTAVNAKKLLPSEQKEFLQNRRALSGFANVGTVEGFETALASRQAAKGGGGVQALIANAFADPALQAGIEVNQLNAQAQISDEPQGVRGVLLAAHRRLERARTRKMPIIGDVLAGVGEFLDPVASALTPDFIEGAQFGVALPEPSVDPAAVRALQIQERQLELMEEQRSQQSANPRGRRE